METIHNHEFNPVEFDGIRLADTNCTAFSTIKETAVIPAQAGIQFFKGLICSAIEKWKNTSKKTWIPAVPPQQPTSCLSGTPVAGMTERFCIAEGGF